MSDGTRHRIAASALVFASVAAFSSSATAADVECTDRPECWPEGSAMRTGLLQRQVELRLRMRLKKSHDELVALLSTTPVINGAKDPDDLRLVEAVRSQQKAWLSFRDSECELIGALSTAASPWRSAKAVECESNLTEQRLNRMRHALRCVRRLAPDERRFRQQECLFQLAPMAVPLER